LELKEADPLNQLRSVVPHIADIGPDFPRLDLAAWSGVSRIQSSNWESSRHDRHAVVILRHARRGVRRDDGKAGDSAPAVALPHIVDFDCSGGTLNLDMVSSHHACRGR
jgi:hypothetical protein